MGFQKFCRALLPRSVVYIASLPQTHWCGHLHPPEDPWWLWWLSSPLDWNVSLSLTRNWWTLNQIQLIFKKKSFVCHYFLVSVLVFVWSIFYAPAHHSQPPRRIGRFGRWTTNWWWHFSAFQPSGETGHTTSTKISPMSFEPKKNLQTYMFKVFPVAWQKNEKFGWSIFLGECQLWQSCRQVA